MVYLASLLALFIHAAADINGAVFAAGDDIWFQPIIYNVARSDELIHPFMSPIKPNEQDLLLWHGWLMPEVQSGLQRLLLPGTFFAEIRFSGHVLSALIFTGFSAFFLKIFGPVKAVITAPIFLCLLLYQIGRPELIGSGVLLGYLLTIHYADQKYKTLLTSLGIALLIVTSPILGVYLSLLTVFVFFL